MAVYKKSYYVKRINEKLKQYGINKEVDESLSISTLANMLRYFHIARIRVTTKLVEKYYEEFEKNYAKQIKKKFGINA